MKNFLADPLTSTRTAGKEHGRQEMLNFVNKLWRQKADAEVETGLKEKRNVKSKCLTPNWKQAESSTELRRAEEPKAWEEAEMTDTWRTGLKNPRNPVLPHEAT